MIRVKIKYWRLFAAAFFFANSAILSAQATVPVGTEDIATTSSGDPVAGAPQGFIDTASFATGSAFRAFAMSPDGKRLAILREVDNAPEVVLIDTETLVATSRITVDEGKSIGWIRWAGNDKLLMSIAFRAGPLGVFYPTTRIMVRDLARDSGYFLDVDRTVFDGDDLIHVANDGSFALVSVQKNVRQYPSVYRYALVPDAEPERVVKPKTGVWSWHADDAGVVRLGMGWRHKRLRIYYRHDAAEDFELVGKLKPGDEESRFWSVVQIVGGSDRGYVLEEGENGRVGVRLFDYGSGEVIDTFYEHPEWDVDRIWLDENGEPIAAFYTDDRDQTVWFDEEYERFYRQLKKALGQENVSVVSRSQTGDRMLIWAGSESDPGALYVFTPDQKKLATFANYRPAIDFRQLVKPRPVGYTARDGLEISAYLTIPRDTPPEQLPLIILPHGGPFGVRDKLEYNDQVQLLANRGYAVLQPNFRGSGGYGDAFYEAGEGTIGRAMQDDLDDAMDWAVAEGIADPERVCVVGGSYGGYAALWAVLRNPDRYRCAASWAGVTDLDAILKYDRQFLTRKDSRVWRQMFEGEEEFDIDDVSPIARAKLLNRPVLLAHGTADRTVPFKQYEAFEEASREAPVPPTLLEIKGEGHGFSSSANEKAWYDALEAFLLQHNPPQLGATEGRRAVNAIQAQRDEGAD